MFRVSVEVADDRLKAMTAAPELSAAAIQAGADYWHTGILPKHFEAGAGAVYGYAARSITYLKDRRKSGKPSLVFSGSLRRDLKARAAFKTSGKTTVELKMTARVLNFVPNMAQNDQDYYVKHKNSRGYPNLKREIKLMTDDEREAVAAVTTKQLALSFDPAAAPTPTVPTP